MLHVRAAPRVEPTCTPLETASAVEILVSGAPHSFDSLCVSGFILRLWCGCCRWSVDVLDMLEHLCMAYYMPWVGTVAGSGREGHRLLAGMVLRGRVVQCYVWLRSCYV